MRALFIDPLSFLPEFTRTFQRLSPETTSYLWPNAPADGDYDVLVAWKMPPEAFPLPTSVQAIFCFGAGADHLLDHPDIPAHLPIARLIDKGQAEQILNYALHTAFARLQDDQQRLVDQREGQWRSASQAVARRRDSLVVTVLGLGPIGEHVAKGLAAAGFSTRGWSRSAKAIDDLATYSGDAGLAQAARDADVVINLLPLRPETENILSVDLFRHFSPAAYLVNLGRGGHLHEEDLRQALDNGQIGCAWLDVFRGEPLDPAHWFWTHDRVRITPHRAGLPTPDGAAASVAAFIDALATRSPLPGLVRDGRDEGRSLPF